MRYLGAILYYIQYASIIRGFFISKTFFSKLCANTKNSITFAISINN